MRAKWMRLLVHVAAGLQAVTLAKAAKAAAASMMTGGAALMMAVEPTEPIQPLKPLETAKTLLQDVGHVWGKGIQSLPLSQLPTGVSPQVAPQAVPQAQVYLLAGQSNMVGEVSRADLPPTLTQAHPTVKIWQLLSDSFVPLQPGFAGGTWSAWGEGFGPELSFGWAIAQTTPADIYLIKYGLGATNLAKDWHPEGYDNQHDIFVSRVDRALAGLTQQGITYHVAGMLWVQGENDAFESEDFARRYRANLRALIADMRDRYNPSLKFAIGQLHPDLHQGFGYADTIRSSQAAVARTDRHVYLVRTRRYSLQADQVHYDAAGQIGLGEGFAAVLAD